MTLPTNALNGSLQGRRPQNVLTPAFVRNVAKAGRYGRVSDLMLTYDS